MELVETQDILRQCEAYENRLIALRQILESKPSYPFNLQILGFGSLSVESEDELKGRIKELCDILNLDIEAIEGFG